MLGFLMPLFWIKNEAQFRATIYVYVSSFVFLLFDTCLRLFNLLRNITSFRQNYWVAYAQFKQSFLVKDTNTISLYIILVFSLSVYLYFRNKRQIFKIFIILSPLVFVLTLSREAFLAVLVSVIVLFPFMKNKITKKFFLHVIAFFVLLILLAFCLEKIIRQDLVSFLLNRYLGTISFITEEGFKQRINFVKYAYNIFQGSPLIGVGLGSYLESGFIFFHNLFITLILSTGLIGLVLFFLQIMFIAINMRTKRKSFLGELGIWTLAVYLIQGFAMFDLTEVYFWTYLGIITIGMEVERHVKDQN